MRRHAGIRAALGEPSEGKGQALMGRDKAHTTNPLVRQTRMDGDMLHVYGYSPPASPLHGFPLDTCV